MRSHGAAGWRMARELTGWVAGRERSAAADRREKLIQPSLSPPPPRCASPRTPPRPHRRPPPCSFGHASCYTPHASCYTPHATRHAPRATRLPALRGTQTRARRFASLSSSPSSPPRKPRAAAGTRPLPPARTVRGAPYLHPPWMRGMGGHPDPAGSARVSMHIYTICEYPSLTVAPPRRPRCHRWQWQPQRLEHRQLQFRSADMPHGAAIADPSTTHSRFGRVTARDATHHLRPAGKTRLLLTCNPPREPQKTLLASTHTVRPRVSPHTNGGAWQCFLNKSCRRPIVP